jgi:hypothetical protein
VCGVMCFTCILWLCHGNHFLCIMSCCTTWWNFTPCEGLPLGSVVSDSMYERMSKAEESKFRLFSCLVGACLDSLLGVKRVISMLPLSICPIRSCEWLRSFWLLVLSSLSFTCLNKVSMATSNALCCELLECILDVAKLLIA